MFRGAMQRWMAFAMVGLAMSLGGCGGPLEAEEPGNSSEDSSNPNADDHSSLSTINLTTSVTSTWPKTVTWTSDHTTHNPHNWSVSWQSSLLQTSTNKVTRSVSSEACNLWARVSTDSLSHTSADLYRNVIDDRAISMTSSYTVNVGSSPSIAVPTPHRTRHCGGTGSFIFQVKSGSSWIDISSSQNVSPWSPPASPTTGYETYRVKCSHSQGATHYSNEIRVTWQAASVCDYDGRCDSGETKFNCPEDCLPDYCDPICP
jgi:hypothetical protein